jgi:serine/threonine-protein kinase HipA
MDPEGHLWVAKFPSRSDEFDVGAWESLVYGLAQQAGIQIVQARAERFSKQGTTFLIKRFDRAGENRVHFASAMTLLGVHDGDNAETGASYLDLVELIEEISESPTKDLEELWRRIVFNMLIHNTDDHLRNHGFLLGTKGWRLSPVYDINPQPWPGGLSLNVDESSNDCDLELARSVAEYFRLDSKQADKVITQLQSAVKGWENAARALTISRDEVERMRVAFRS